MTCKSNMRMNEWVCVVITLTCTVSFSLLKLDQIGLLKAWIHLFYFKCTTTRCTWNKWRQHLCFSHLNETFRLKANMWCSVVTFWPLSLLRLMFRRLLFTKQLTTRRDGGGWGGERELKGREDVKTEGVIEVFTMHRRRLQSQIEIVTALEQSCRAYMDTSEKLAEIWPPIMVKRYTCRSRKNATEQGGKIYC